MAETRRNDTATDLIRDLAAVLREHDLSEIEFDDGAVKLRIARTLAAAPIAYAAPASGAMPAAAPAPSAAGEHRSAPPPGAVLSPMVGTVYRSPAPGEASFVAVGQKVTAGATLLIVEAMKTFNPIAAPRDGVVKAILVEDAQPVEYGEPLIVLE
jgi:acetyl-CoA carboxylase biotin carboxyl carrier protein